MAIRRVGWSGAVGLESPAFNAVNRGKRSLVLNLKHADRTAHVPAVGAVVRHRSRELSTWGDAVARARLSTRWRPPTRALIYASISGYGQTGPDRDKGGFDLIAQGVCRHHVDHRRARRGRQ